MEDTRIGEEIGHGGTDGSMADNVQKREAVEALVALGYGRAEAIKAVNAVKGIENMDSGAALKAALKKMF